MNQNHYFEACTVTDRFCHDDSQVKPLLEQISEPIDQFTGDGDYDETLVYETVLVHSPNADVVIPPRANAVVNDKAATFRNRNIREIKESGRMKWQKDRQYGRRNYSELPFYRYQRILGYSLHAREINRQEQEVMLGCGVMNKMTSLGMLASYRSA